jgi:RNase P/RNase MRP subunit p29
MRDDEDTVEVEGVIINQTCMAVLLSTGDEEVWIPKSQIVSRDENKDGTTTLEIPEWLAMEKGLI